MRTVRLALLLCDEITPPLGADYGNHTQIFYQFLFSSLQPITLEVTFTLDAYDVVNDMAYPPDDAHYDGILISGARASAYEDVEWINKLAAYIKHIIASKPSLKIFGMCFGHQIIARALGFCVKRGDWEVSVTAIQLSSIGRAIFQTDKLNLQLMHRDQVSTSLPGAQLFGSTVVALNQGFALFDDGEAPLHADPHSDALHVPLTSIHVLTFQAHPEFTESIIRALIAEFAEKLGSKELLDDALLRVGYSTDAIDKVGKAIWGVLGVA